MEIGGVAGLESGFEFDHERVLSVAVRIEDSKPGKDAALMGDFSRQNGCSVR